MPGKAIAYIAEQDLVAKLKLGNQKAFEILYDKYAPVIVCMLEHLKVSEQKSEEVLLSSFMKIKNEMGSYDSSKMRLFTWILILARETINETCIKELDLFKIQKNNKYVENKSPSLDSTGPSLLGFVMTKDGGYDELAQLIGINREELMILIKKEINLMKKSK